MSIGVKSEEDGEYLVKIYDDLTTEVIANLSDYDCEYEAYDYYDGKVCIQFEGNDEGMAEVQVYTIDLESEEENLVYDTLLTDVELDFSYYNEQFYYISTDYPVEYCYINSFDMDGNSVLSYMGEEDNEIISMQIDKDNNIIYFMKNVYEDETCQMTVCAYDIDTSDVSEILTAGAIGDKLLINNGYLVCKLVDYGLENNSFYVYNINTNEIWELGTTDYISEDYKNYVTFSEKYIIFSDGKNVELWDYEGNIINSSLYSTDDEEEIYDVTMLSSNILQIRIYDDLEEKITETYLVDFENSTIEEVTENYYDVILIQE